MAFIKPLDVDADHGAEGRHVLGRRDISVATDHKKLIPTLTVWALVAVSEFR